MSGTREIETILDAALEAEASRVPVRPDVNRLLDLLELVPMAAVEDQHHTRRTLAVSAAAGIAVLLGAGGLVWAAGRQTHGTDPIVQVTDVSTPTSTVADRVVAVTPAPTTAAPTTLPPTTLPPVTLPPATNAVPPPATVPPPAAASTAQSAAAGAAKTATRARATSAGATTRKATVRPAATAAPATTAPTPPTTAPKDPASRRGSGDGRHDGRFGNCSDGPSVRSWWDGNARGAGRDGKQGTTTRSASGKDRTRPTGFTPSG